MKLSKFSESQIVGILKKAETGTPIGELCREHGISTATFYKWRSKYSGIASMLSRLKTLERENARLKKMYSDERLHVNGRPLLGLHRQSNFAPLRG